MLFRSRHGGRATSMTFTRFHRTIARPLVASLSLAAVALAGMSHEARSAGAAYQVDTAEVSEPGSCKVEAWGSAASNHDAFAAITPACVMDIYRPVEVSSQFNRSVASDVWASGATPKLKTNLMPTAIGR